MSSMQKLNDDELNNVIGGATRYINTHTGSNAVVRSDAGKEFDQVASLANGTRVNTTGETVENFSDGRIWYEIDYPVYGWIAGSLLES